MYIYTIGLSVSYKKQVETSSVNSVYIPRTSAIFILGCGFMLSNAFLYFRCSLFSFVTVVIVVVSVNVLF